MIMPNYFDLPMLWFAQSGDNVAQNTRQLLTQITTLKITKAIFVLLVCYLSLKLIDRLVAWISERIARE